MKNIKEENKNERYLLGLRDRDPKILQEIYSRFFPMLAQHVRKQGGSEEDAKDVFQDTIVVLFRKQQNKAFELRSSFSTFLYAVGKKVWLKKASLRGKRREQDLENLELPEEMEIEKELEKTERNRLFRAKLNQLGQDCQKVLRLFFEGLSMAKIAQIMGYASEGYAKKRKFQCKQKLTQLIKSDPRYIEMTN